MANNKIDRINKEIAKTREKITEYQNKLKGLEAQKTEAENLEIVQLVRAMRLTPQELNAMLSGGGIPGMTAAPARRTTNRRKMQMKNKLKKTMTALCAALILMGGFSVPAYAQGAATEPNAGDATNDSGVIVEENAAPYPKGKRNTG